MRQKAGIFLSLLFIAFPASAAKLATSPVRIDLSGRKPTAILSVLNEGNTSSIIDVTPVSWHQKENEDVYETTKDLLAVPALFELGPGEKQMVRIGLRKPPEVDNERAYRIYLNEVPDESVSKEGTIRVLLRIGIPVFVLPNRPAVSTLEWKASCVKGKLRLEGTNVGNVNARILGLSLKRQADKKELAQLKSAGTLLAGAERSWEFGVSECPTERSMIELLAETAKGPLNAQIMLGK